MIGTTLLSRILAISLFHIDRLTSDLFVYEQPMRRIPLALFPSPVSFSTDEMDCIPLIGMRIFAPLRIVQASRMETVPGIFPVFIVFSRARAHRRISCRKKLQEISHVVDVLDPT